MQEIIIDLSKKAAEELGFIKNGVAKVRVEILEDESRKYALSEQQNVYVAEAAEITEVSKKNLLPNLEFEEKKIKKKNEDVLENSILNDNSNFDAKNTFSSSFISNKDLRKDYIIAGVFSIIFAASAVLIFITG